MNKILFIVFSLVMFVFAGVNAQHLALPCAKRTGAYVATGVRGSVVIKVANVNDSESGNLREAILMTTPKKH